MSTRSWTRPRHFRSSASTCFSTLRRRSCRSVHGSACNGRACLTFAEEVRHVQEYHELAVRWILPTFVDGRTRKSSEIMEALRGKYGDLATFPVRYSSALSEASGWGKTIFEYKPKDRAAADYARIAGAVA